ncbi:MAG: class I SAM-dependent methyltransferase [Bacteroidota bacterium]
MRSVDANKFQLQNSQYTFPYHYIPHFKKDGTPSVTRNLRWGLEYLCYQNHLRAKTISMSPRSVLEVGCGDGFFIGRLPKSIQTRIGCDLSTEAISFAKAFWPDCIFYDTDVYEIDGKFDLVAAIEVLEHIPDDCISIFISSLAEKLHPSGNIIISVPTINTPLNKKHYRHYTLSILEKQIRESGTGLKIVQHEYIYSNPFWMDIITRLISNRFFALEINFFMKFAWKRIWRYHRVTTPSRGRHLVSYICF